MEVKLKAGDSLNIPEGCKAVIKDGSVVFEREEEDKEFKDGDILIDDRKLSEFPCKIIMIYKGTKSEEGCYECYIFRNLMGSLVINGECCGSKFVRIRHASEEEKAELFAEMKEQGLQWNAEKKEVEKVRWRAKKGDRFYCFDTDFSVLDGLEEGSKLDDSSWRSYNYFRTVEQVEEAARRIKEVLHKYHEEIGE